MKRLCAQQVLALDSASWPGAAVMLDLRGLQPPLAGDDVEQQMDKATVQELIARGHRTDVIDDNYQDFGAGQFIWRMGDTRKEGYVVASDSRRDGLAAGF